MPEAVEVDYVVYAAVKAGEGVYECQVALTPNEARTVWTGSLEPCLDCVDCEEEGACICNGSTECDFQVCSCEPICIAALVKHPCCPGEEVAIEVVTPDCAPPKVDLQMRFVDCDPCEDDLCLADCLYVEFTSVEAAGDICGEPGGCCKDDCSGVADWALTLGVDICAEPCEIIAGTDCPVEGQSGCDCICFPATGEKCVIMSFDIEDNVGNDIETLYWQLCLNTDEIISFEDGTYDTTTGVFTPGTDITPEWATEYQTEWVPVIEGSCVEPD